MPCTVEIKNQQNEDIEDTEIEDERENNNKMRRSDIGVRVRVVFVISGTIADIARG